MEIAIAINIINILIITIFSKFYLIWLKKSFTVRKAFCVTVRSFILYYLKVRLSLILRALQHLHTALV